MTVELILGDCLEVMKGMPDKSVDAIITDPPYGTTNCKFDKSIELSKMWEQLNGFIKENGIITMFSSQPFTTDLIVSNRKCFRYELIWEKSIGSMYFDANCRPLKNHENILIFCKVGIRGENNKLQTVYNPQMVKGQPYKKINTAHRSSHYHSAGGNVNNNIGERFPLTVMKFPNGNHNSMHPTQKPTKLMEWLIETYTNAGDTVLDPFMGSGTTGVACVQTGRNFIGIEIDPTYFSIAEKRIKEAQMQMKLEFK